MIKKYSIEEVHAQYGKGKIDFDGDKINCNSQRIQLFSQKGIKCVDCGLEAEYYRKTPNGSHAPGTYHINLYGVKDGVEVLFTKDHTKPKSKGGRNHISNYQTMCTKCNSKKADKF